MSYRDAIAAATGLSGSDLAQVEHIMRLERPTLDALDRRQFDALARRAAAALAALKREAITVELELTEAQDRRVSVPALAEMEGIYAIAMGHPLLGTPAVLTLTGIEEPVRWVLERIVKIPRAAATAAIVAARN